MQIMVMPIGGRICNNIEKYMIFIGIGRNMKENIREKVWSIQRAIKDRENETNVSVKVAV